jgi:hypothetical protein
VAKDMPQELPHFESDDEMREWFDTADLSEYKLDQALEVAVATHVRLSVGNEPAEFADRTSGATGTLRDPVRLVGV